MGQQLLLHKPPQAVPIGHPERNNTSLRSRHTNLCVPSEHGLPGLEPDLLCTHVAAGAACTPMRKVPCLAHLASVASSGDSRRGMRQGMRWAVS